MHIFKYPQGYKEISENAVSGSSSFIPQNLFSCTGKLV
jgi:hypothetical protein